MRLVALLLCVSLPTWADDLPPTMPMQTTTVGIKAGIVTLDSGQSARVGDGCWLPSKTCVDMATNAERLKAENKALLERTSIGPVVVIVVAALALGAGFVVGKVVK